MTGAEILMGVAAMTSLAGGVVGAAGAQQQAAAAAAAGNYNAALMDEQVRGAERNRQIALDQAEAEAKEKRSKFRAMNGQIRAAYGASGLAVEGSPLDVLQATAIEEELDIDKTLYQGDLRAMEWEEKGRSFRGQAQLMRMGASSASAASGIGMATSLLSGVSGAARSFTPTAYGGRGGAGAGAGGGGAA